MTNDKRHIILTLLSIDFKNSICWYCCWCPWWKKLLCSDGPTFSCWHFSCLPYDVLHIFPKWNSKRWWTAYNFPLYNPDKNVRCFHFPGWIFRLCIVWLNSMILMHQSHSNPPFLPFKSRRETETISKLITCFEVSNTQNQCSSRNETVISCHSIT